ncbi:hypothetical protein AVEN_193666-1 [Araneus ventricosus]|uniref:Uncharacterized protein n=1 Tax=Araneus ventricosus TaxID=182803 RepID=A0A4Y2VZ89_ARAVE|nr:hypothetical protein AVEN_193666-1 [Araneus ventricosus]
MEFEYEDLISPSKISPRIFNSIQVGGLRRPGDEDARLHVLRTMFEHTWQEEWEHCHLGSPGNKVWTELWTELRRDANFHKCTRCLFCHLCRGLFACRD